MEVDLELTIEGEAAAFAAGLTVPSLVTADEIVAAAGADVVLTTQGFGEIGPEAALGAPGAGLAGTGADVAGFAGTGVTAVVDFAVSFFRKSPRATRKVDRKSTRLNSSHWITSRMPSSA